MKILTGIPAAPGIVSGKALLFPDDNPEIPRYAITMDQAGAELVRFAEAVRAAAEELRNFKQGMGREQEAIFDAHLLMVEDPDFHYQIKARLESNYENIEWIVFEVARDLSRKLTQSSSAYLRERAADVSDVSRRIVNRLLGIERFSLANLREDVILVARNLLPSDALSMDRRHVRALVMEAGSRLSHTAILVRAFGIPSVMGVSAAMREIAEGTSLLVDGGTGRVILEPNETTLEHYGEKQAEEERGAQQLSPMRELDAQTVDGRRVRLLANIEIPEEAGNLDRYGAEGVGLYRSEFLFLSGRQSSEDQQYEAYRRVVEALAGKPVTIRTIDIGGDKIIPGMQTGEENPLLGWRAIRFSLSLPETFKTQLRAILRASACGPVRIMFPMISGIEELETSLALLEEAKAECRKSGRAFDETIQAGSMIEVPSAVMTADILAEKSDFFSIGTNDLIQYTIAADRGNKKVSSLAQPSHPAVLRSIKQVIDAAKRRGIPAAMCGELAGESSAAALLLGMGLEEYSMSAPSIPAVKRVLRSVSAASCEALVYNALSATHCGQVQEALTVWHRENLPGLDVSGFTTEKPADDYGV